MDQKTNRTFLCSVVFLDIVNYSQQSVDEQIRLKSRFNAILAEALKDVAQNARIILDTGDGAAISFLGDPEDALFVALSIRDAIISDEGSTKPPLSARIGINMGPVKLVKDINSRRNLIGDGINVAQRVMNFADPGQILVSRSYFEVISRLTLEYAKLFHYEGSRVDKHVREHEVYSVAPEEKEEAPLPIPPTKRKIEQSNETAGGDALAPTAETATGGKGGKNVSAEEGQPLRTPQSPALLLNWKKMLGSWSVKWLDWLRSIIGNPKSFNWNEIRSNHKLLYVVAALIVILISVPFILWKTEGTPAKDAGTVPAQISVAAPEIDKKTKTPVEVKKVETPTEAKKAETPMVAKKVETPVATNKTETSALASDDQKKTEASATPDKSAVSATVILGIAPWGEVYLDGNMKGVSPPLNSLQVTPGEHLIEIRNTTFTPYKKTVNIKSGEELKIIHKFR